MGVPYRDTLRVSCQELRGCAARPKYKAIKVASPRKNTVMATMMDMLIIDPRDSAHHEKRDQIERDRGFQHHRPDLVMKERLGIAGIDKTESRQHDERQQGDDDRARPRLRGERAQLKLRALATAHPLRHMLENLGQAAADITLYPDRRDQEAQFFDRRPLVHRLQRERHGHAELDLFDDQTQLLRYRVGQILR